MRPPVRDWTRVQHVVFPESDAAGRAPLYIRPADVAPTWTRESLRLQARATVSTATYFGVFPAGYWLRHTDVTRVRLSLRVSDECTVTVRATDNSGRVSVLEERDCAGGAIDIDVDLGDPRASGRVWFELRAGDRDIVADAMRWTVPAGDRPASTATVCITTFDRGEDCLRLLRRLASEPAVAERVDRILVVDQGGRPVRAEPGFPEAAAMLGGRLSVLEQPNLGGSGGFSRGMLEAVGGSSEYALLLDDDVDLETESLLRLLAFADHVRGTAIVGAHMLSLTEPTVLHSYGERVDRRSFWWGPVQPSLSAIDLAAHEIESTPALSDTYDVDFNGWWMCLIPLSLIREAGAALPFFLKWDDAEFGLRAAEYGVPTISLPGAALWHMPWTNKDDGLDWQAYVQLRNRIVTALLHSGDRSGAGLLWASFLQDANHILCMQYGSAALRRLAVRDALAGPEALRRSTREHLPQVRRLLADAGQVIVPIDSVIVGSGAAALARPSGLRAIAARAARVGLHQLRRPRRRPAVEALLERDQGKWWALGLLDSAAVRSSAGTGVFVFRRRSRLALSLLIDAVGLRVRLHVRWRALARDYRANATRLSSLEQWRAEFADDRSDAVT